MHLQLVDKDEATANGKSEMTNIAKATAMVTLFVLSFVIGCIPIKLNKMFQWANNAKDNGYVKMLLGLGGGVLMCTTFLHLLPEVAATFEVLNLTPKLEIHYAELLMCTGFFTMYFVEECVHVYLHRKEMNSGSDDIKVLSRSMSIRRSKEKINQEIISGETKEKISIESKEAELGMKKKDVVINNLDLHHSHKHSHLAVDNEAIDSTVKAIRGLLVVLALSVHELFEGMAIGLESSSSAVWYMFGAVSAHKLVIAFCIGVELVISDMKTKLVIIYVFTFAVVSPIGIGTGLIVTNTDSNSTSLLSVILQGLASGTLLYVVFFEILQDENKTGLKQFISVLCGFLIMFGISLLG